MLATEYAEWHKIDPQAEDESDSAFRSRVAGELRKRGAIIEAHEVQQDRRYEEDMENGCGIVLDGILGAVIQDSGIKDYGKTGSTRVGDDIAVGIVAQRPEREHMSTETVMMMLALFGGR